MTKKANTSLPDSNLLGAKCVAAAATHIPIESSNKVSTSTQPMTDQFASYPALSRLRLTTGDLDELRQQGFLSQERRGDRLVHKLRFRRSNRQVVRSIADAAEAAVVKIELGRLQSRRQIRRELVALERAARRLLRDNKTELEPLVTALGWKFHGREVRRPHPVNSRLV